MWVQHFHPYLHGVQFKLFTNHQPLKGLIDSASSEPKGCRARWILLLQPYTFEIMYKAGKIHHNADTMSRLVCGESDGGVAVTPMVLTAVSATAVGAAADVVATVDRPRREAAVKGAQKVRAWVTDPYADRARQEASKQARGAGKSASNGGVVPSAEAEVVERAKEENNVAAGEKAAGKGKENALANKAVPGREAQQERRPQDEEAADGWNTGDDRRDSVVGTGELRTSEQREVVGTDHTSSPHTAPLSTQQEGASTADNELHDDLLQHVACRQRDDPFLHDILRYLLDKVLPDDDGRARRVATEVAQCFVRGDVLYRSWWPQRADTSVRTRVQLAVPKEKQEAIMFTHHDDLLAGHLGVNHTTDAL